MVVQVKSVLFTTHKNNAKCNNTVFPIALTLKLVKLSCAMISYRIIPNY